jgi:hypothetical protein
VAVADVEMAGLVGLEVGVERAAVLRVDVAQVFFS